MSSPVLKLSQLSLRDTMTPTTGSQFRRLSESSHDHVQARSQVSSEDPGSDSDDSSTSSSDEHNTVVRSPTTKLKYDIGNLPDAEQARIRHTFDDPPKLSLQYCGLRDDVYAFHMTETVPRSIRIGSPNSPFAKPRCSCSSSKSGDGQDPNPNSTDAPCRHLLWLLDQLTSQTHCDADPSSPLTMTSDGFAREVGDPFAAISDFHLDVLAEGLHCEVLARAAESSRSTGQAGTARQSSGANQDESDSADNDDGDDLNPYRIRDTRELLASVADKDPDTYRPDIFSSPDMGRYGAVVKRRDLERTVFRMLQDSDDFFHYFLSLARPWDPVRNPFRKLERRVEHVLRDLSAYSASAATSAGGPGPASASASSSPESHCDVPWAASHILSAVASIRTKLFRRSSPLRPWESSSAARALVRILGHVASRNRDFHPGSAVSDRNLYSRLIGDAGPDSAAGDDFVLGVLLLLPPEAAAPYLQELEDVAELVGVNGAKGSFDDKFKRLLAQLRKPSRGGFVASGTGGWGMTAGKRGIGGEEGESERGSKRAR